MAFAGRPRRAPVGFAKASGKPVAPHAAQRMVAWELLPGPGVGLYSAICALRMDQAQAANGRVERDRASRSGEARQAGDPCAVDVQRGSARRERAGESEQS